MTSRDTSAANFLSEAGLGPLCTTEVILVVRTLPIRVAGNSGPLQSEINWETVAARAGSLEPLIEYTSITKNVRRVAHFEREEFLRALMINRPTGIAVHGVDYLNFRDRGKTHYADLSGDTQAFIEQVQESGGVPVKFVFTGPELSHVIEL